MIGYLVLVIMAVAFLMFFAFIEDPYKRMFIGIILGLFTWITGLCMHSFDKDSLEKKCKIAYELNDKNKRELAKKLFNIIMRQTSFILNYTKLIRKNILI